MFRGGMDEPGGTLPGVMGIQRLVEKPNNQIGGKTGAPKAIEICGCGWLAYGHHERFGKSGIWVGCDDRSVHFTSAETGEGSHTALPIFGAFMAKGLCRVEKVVIHPVRFANPLPVLRLRKEYDCPSPRIDIRGT